MSADATSPASMRPETTADPLASSVSPSQRQQQHLHNQVAHLLTAIAILAGSVLRFSALSYRSLWFDEGYTAWVVSLPAVRIIQVIRADTAPPLYYLLLHWIAPGRSEFALRVPSAVFSTAALLLFVPIARKLLKRPWPVALAVCLYSVSYLQIAYAHEARFYSLLALLGSLQLLLVLKLCDRSTPLRLALLAIVFSAGLWTNNMMVVYQGSLSLAWLIFPGAVGLGRRLVGCAAVNLVAIAAFLPWVSTLRAQSHAVAGHFWSDAPTMASLFTTFSTMAGVRAAVFSPNAIAEIYVAEWIIGISLCVLVLLLLADPGTRRAALGLAVYGTLPVLFVFVYSRAVRSIYMDRAFIITGVALPVLIALPALLRSTPLRRFFMLGLLVLIWMATQSLPEVWIGCNDEDWRDTAGFVSQSPARHRLVIFVANEGELLYDYYARGGDFTPLPSLIGAPAGYFTVEPPHTMRIVDSEHDLAGVAAAINDPQYDEIDFVASHGWFADKNQLTLKLLQSKLRLIEQKNFGRMTVFRFRSSPKQK